MASIQIFSKDMQGLLASIQTEEDWQLGRLEEVKTLTDMTRNYRISDGIAKAIIQFVKAITRVCEEVRHGRLVK